MQKWGFFSMGVMAGIIVVLVMALLAQGESHRAYAAQQSTSPEGEALMMAVGMSQQNLSDIVWVLHKHPPLRALKELGGDNEEAAKMRKQDRLSLMLYKVERNGTAMKFIAARDLSYDEEYVEFKQESPTVKEVFMDLRKNLKEK